MLMPKEIDSQEYEDFENIYFNYLYKLAQGEEHSLDNLCFLCGVELDKENRSNEHVFPKWLIKKFNLDRNMYRFNDDMYIKYRNIMIPCCKDCNNIELSDLENTINKAVESGYEDFIKLEEYTIISWLGKMFYGILFRKLRLRKNIKDPNSVSMINDLELSAYKHTLLIIRSIIIPTIIHGTPWSLSIYKLNIKDKSYFDLLLTSELTFMTIVLGEIGVIVRFIDNNAISGLSKAHRNQFDTVAPTIRQFYEIAALLHYYSSTDINEKKFTIIQEEDPTKVSIFPQITIKPNFWSNEDNYKKFASGIHKTFLKGFNLKQEDVYCEEKNTLITTLSYLEDK